MLVPTWTPPSISQDGHWYVVLTPSLVEMLGGGADGRVHYESINVNLLSLLALFDNVTEAHYMPLHPAAHEASPLDFSRRAGQGPAAKRPYGFLVRGVRCGWPGVVMLLLWPPAGAPTTARLDTRTGKLHFLDGE
jgi:hypothetical protein